MKRKGKTRKIILAIIIFIVILLIGIPSKRETGCQVTINQNNNTFLLENTKKFKDGGNLDMTVNIRKGEAIIQILNEKDDILLEDVFSEGTSKIDSAYLNDFQSITLNVVTDNAEGDVEMSLIKWEFGIDKFK